MKNHASVLSHRSAPHRSADLLAYIENETCDRRGSPDPAEPPDRRSPLRFSPERNNRSIQNTIHQQLPARAYAVIVPHRIDYDDTSIL